QSRVQLFKDIPEPFDLLVTFRTDNVQYSSLLIVNQVLHQQIKILIERRLGLHLQLKEAVRRQVKPVPKFNFGQGSYSFFKASRLVKKIFRLNQQMVLSIPFFLDQVKFLRSFLEGFINSIQGQLVILDPKGSVLR